MSNIYEQEVFELVTNFDEAVSTEWEQKFFEAEPDPDKVGHLIGFSQAELYELMMSFWSEEDGDLTREDFKDFCYDVWSMKIHTREEKCKRLPQLVELRVAILEELLKIPGGSQVKIRFTPENPWAFAINDNEFCLKCFADECGIEVSDKDLEVLAVLAFDQIRKDVCK